MNLVKIVVNRVRIADNDLVTELIYQNDSDE